MSLVSIDFQITNASAPFDFSVKDQNGVERFVSTAGNKIYFNSISPGIHTVKVTKNNCVISNEVITVNCNTPTPTPSCTTPILSVLSIENDKRASFSITNVSDCLSMELQYSTDINFLNYIPVYIGCVANQVITFPDNAIYHVRIMKTCINNLLKFSNAVSVNTIIGSSNCYVFAGCLHIGNNPASDTYRITLKHITSSDVNFTLSNGTIIRILAGSYYGQEIINIGQGCPTVVSNDLHLFYCPVTPITPTPTPCTGITNLVIVGNSSVVANGTNQYSLSYTGNQPLTYNWNISGQGTSIISGQNANTFTAKFGSSGNFIVSLDITDSCGHTISATKQISLSSQPACDIIISNINIVCNNTNSSTVTVLASSASNKTLRYGVLGFVNYQVSNIFNLPSSDTNGYTFQVVELGNETNCRVDQNRIVSCLPVPSPTPVPVACNLAVTSVNVICNSANNATLTVNTFNPDNYVLQYQIDNYITWQDSNVFTGITNSGTGYIVSVRNKNNTSCTAFKNNVYVDCLSTPVGCTPITNLVITGNSTIVANSINSYNSSYSGSTSTNYLWSISGQGTSIIGANNTSSVNFQMGNSNGTITLEVTNCNGVAIQTFPFNVAVQQYGRWSMAVCDGQEGAGIIFVLSDSGNALSLGNVIKDNFNTCFQVLAYFGADSATTRFVSSVSYNSCLSCITAIPNNIGNPQTNSYFVINKTTGLTTAISACAEYSVERSVAYIAYTANPVITQGMTLYANTSLTTGLATGYYSNGIKSYHVINGIVQDVGTLC